MASLLKTSQSPAATAERLRRDLEEPILVDEVNRQLTALGVIETDDIIFCNWQKGDASSMCHQRACWADVKNGKQTIYIREEDYSFGFIPAKPLPKPEGWQGWFDEYSWDDQLQHCWKEEVFGTKNKEIDHCRALMADSDGGLNYDQAKKIIIELGLPEPTLEINTGGRGFHFYWTYKTPLEPAAHRHLMRRLMKAFEPHPEFGIDKSLHNPNRVMRLAGTIHPQTRKRAFIEAETSNRFDESEFEFLPAINERMAVIETDDTGLEIDEAALSEKQKDGAVYLQNMHANPSAEVLQKLGIDGYQYWLKTGMALKALGLGVELWDEWSAGNTDPDHGYQDGDCDAKWDSFDGMISNPSAWLNKAAQACGYRLEDSLKGFCKSSRSPAERKEHHEAHMAAQKAAKARWDYEFEWELEDHETIETKIETALNKKLRHEESELIYLNGLLRRYDPKRGFYAPWSDTSIKAEIGKLLENVFTWKKVGDNFVPANKYGTTPNTKRCFEWIGIHAYKDSLTFVSPTTAIAFKNCTLVKGADGWEQQPHSKGHKLTHGIDHDFVPNAECPPLYKEFIRTSYGLEQLDIWRALMSYHANPESHCRIILFLLGDSGTGKGVALRLIQKLYPQLTVSALSNFTQIAGPEKLAQQVAKSYLLTFPDLQGRQEDVGPLYALTDYDQIHSGRDLFSKEPIQFKWRGRVCIGSTQMPNLRDANTGFKRRLLTVQTLDERLDSDLISSDPTKIDIWEDDLAAELGAIVSWALSMPEVAVAKILAKQHPVLAATSQAVAANIDSLHTFVDQCLVPTDADHRPDENDLYSAFNCFLEVQGQKNAPAFQTFKSRLRNILGHLHQKRSGSGQSNNRVPAHFFGFMLPKELWDRREVFSIRATAVGPRHSNHGWIDRANLGEGNLELLAAHNPKQQS